MPGRLGHAMASGEHACRDCGRKFGTKDALGRHARTAHGARRAVSGTQLAVAAVVLLLVAGGVAALTWRAAPEPGGADPEEAFSLSSSPRQGSDDAPVKLFAFESPQCSACRYFHVGDGSGPSTYDRIVSEYVATGKVQYVEKTFYIGYPWEKAASYAQKCVWHMAPEKFHLLTTAIYASQDRISASNLGSFLAQWAEGNGVDADALRSCTDSKQYAAEAESDVAEGRRAGARGTPTFIVVGPTGEARIIPGPQPFATFERAFQDALGQ